QQFAGLWKHRQLRQATPQAVRLGAIMGGAGVGGVAVGVALLHRTSDALVTAILAVVMLLAAVQIAWESRRPDPEESPAPDGLSPLP
ncbi:MAG TPA: TSUP family transporter, partial [Thermoplasmata archaeon]|nr:TSUP family transporter [Thermoplasmata archaeon]